VPFAIIISIKYGLRNLAVRKMVIYKRRCNSCGRHYIGEGEHYCSKRCSKLNENNVNWKGNKASLSAIHIWVKARKSKPDFCEGCGRNKPYDLANISQEYKRDINDFKWLCRKCHMEEDKRMFNLKNIVDCKNKKDYLNWVNLCKSIYYLFNGKPYETRRKMVLQLGINGNLIKEFDGMRIAERETGISHAEISSCCLNKTNSAGGFVWKLK
jgi:predicted nucleic acid-binding Zn ribbon protein